MKAKNSVSNLETYFYEARLIFTFIPSFKKCVFIFVEFS